jgi:hypothetical protein
MGNCSAFRHVTAAVCIASLAINSYVPAGFAATDRAVGCSLQTYIRRCTPPPPPPQPSGSHDHDGGLLGFLIAAAIIGGIVAATNALSGKEKSVDEIDREGPKAPEREFLGRYQVQGLVYPGWPVVVEVRAQPGTTTYIQIVPNGHKAGDIPPLVIGDDGGKPWGDHAVIRPTEEYATDRGMFAKFFLPGNLGGAGNSRNSSADGFRSARLSVLSGHFDGQNLSPEPLEVFALGAGPNAVGSAAVVISRFEPKPSGRRAVYTITYNEKRQFDKLKADLVERIADQQDLRRKTVAEQDICFDRSGANLCIDGPPTNSYQTSGEWPQQPGGQLDPGQLYHMELRAWSVRSPVSGWLLDQAPQGLTWP